MSRSETVIIESRAGADWDRWLRDCGAFDFYHTAAYHRLEERQENSQGILIGYREGDRAAAMPFLLRSLRGLRGLDSAFDEWFDATSVYGYAGPVSNLPWDDEGFTARFGNCLHETLVDQKVISAFSRLHPLIGNHVALSIGRIIQLGSTVAIDLTALLAEQRAAYRKSYRYDIRQARQQGIKVIHDVDWLSFDAFIDMYRGTMNRLDAHERYAFDAEYFYELRRALEGRLHLFVANRDGEPLAGALFTLTNGIVQYHLSGTTSIGRQTSATKLIIDDVRQWAIAAGATVLHLGGGVGSSEDGLFFFKAGFSEQHQPFYVWQAIINEERFEDAVRQWGHWQQETNELAISDYFPIYRTPLKD